MQRLFVFVPREYQPLANGQAICNAEIARLLKVPLEALGVSGAKALSAGYLTIGDVARRVGVSASVLRSWESL
ncbi:MAG: hypothetical protein L0Z62_04425, partial [Gemmataceae bacterium]|nr:hypothetical protein [Gemmataceae bacterium]